MIDTFFESKMQMETSCKHHIRLAVYQLNRKMAKKCKADVEDKNHPPTFIDKSEIISHPIFYNNRSVNGRRYSVCETTAIDRPVIKEVMKNMLISEQICQFR